MKKLLFIVACSAATLNGAWAAGPFGHMTPMHYGPNDIRTIVVSKTDQEAVAGALQGALVMTGPFRPIRGTAMTGPFHHTIQGTAMTGPFRPIRGTAMTGPFHHTTQGTAMTGPFHHTIREIAMTGPFHSISSPVA
jgi:hypothetical protein